MLDQRIGAIPDFQRARGALRLLAEVVAHVWSTGTDAEILNVADIGFENPHVLALLTVAIDRPQFENVARADFAGASSHAHQVDQTRFAGRLPYASRACRAVFVHSLEQVTTAGAGRSDYLLGTLRIGDEPTVIGEALAEVERIAWHLAYDGARWRFTIEPQPPKIVSEEAQNVTNTLVNQELDDRITRMFPTDGAVAAIHFPVGPVSVGDEPRLRIVLMHPFALTVTDRTAMPPPSTLTHMLDRVGASENIRTYRNAVCFLVADEDGRESMRDRVRFDIAAHRVVADKQRMEQFAPEVQKRLRAIADSAKLEARVAIARCYKHLYYPTADKANGNLRHLALAPKAQGDVEKAQTKVLIDVLRDEGKIRTQAMGTDYLVAKAWPKNAVESNAAAMLAWFWRDFGAQVVLDPTIIRDAIRELVRTDEYVYFDAETRQCWTATDPHPPVKLSSDGFLYTKKHAQELGVTRRAITIEDIVAVMSGGQLNAAALRAGLETRLGYEPGKDAVVAALARAADGGKAAKVVVVAGPAEPGAKALRPAEVGSAAWDTMTVLDPADAEALPVDRGVAKPVKVVNAKGAAGVAFQQLLDKVADVPGTTGLQSLSITAMADPGEGARDISLLGKAIGMLPKFDIVAAIEVELDFAGLQSDVAISLSGGAHDYQRIEDAVLALARLASVVAGELRLDLRFAVPLKPGEPEIEQLRKVLTTLQPGTLRLQGVLE